MDLIHQVQMDTQIKRDTKKLKPKSKLDPAKNRRWIMLKIKKTLSL